MVWKDKKNRIKPNQLIKIAGENMNKTVSAKYGIVPENIEVRIEKMENIFKKFTILWD